MVEETLHDISDTEWEKEVERNPKPVFVMFYSPTCSHCIRIQPSVEELAKDFGSEVTFVKINLTRYDYIG